MKRILIVCIGIMVLASCNLPQEPTINPTSVSTIVSGALTQSATFAAQTKTNTSVPIVVTKFLPSITPSVTEFVKSLTPTQAQLTSTQTATSSKTITPTRTPTLDTGDPRSKLGKATWEDRFHDGGYWGLVNTTYDDGSTRIEIKNDSLKFTSKTGKGWHGWRVTYPVPVKFYLEATVHNVNCGASDYYGVLFRATDSFEGYWFGVSCEGKYNLRAGGMGNWKEPIPAKSAPAIVTGSNKTNRLGIMVKGNQITLYINGKLVDNVADSTYSNAGTFGMFIVGWNPGFSFETEEMLYWELP